MHQDNQDDLITIHHELGHNYYFSQYYERAMPNDGFHEAEACGLILA